MINNNMLFVLGALILIVVLLFYIVRRVLRGYDYKYMSPRRERGMPFEAARSCGNAEDVGGGNVEEVRAAPPSDGIFPIAADLVDFNAFSPGKVARNSSFIVDIWIHARQDYPEVHRWARELGRDQLAGTRRGVPLPRGAALRVAVSMEGMEVADPEDTLYWSGVPANVSFAIRVPAACRLGRHSGTALVSHQGLPVARLEFSIQVGKISVANGVDCSEFLFYPKSAFASYSSENCVDVLRRVQGMRALRPDMDIFMDVMSLRAGQNWQAKLEQHVPTKDMFLLFWSRDAARSEWVEREWRMALEKRGLEYIHPVPLDGVHMVPVPRELAALHFNDPELFFIRALDERRNNKVTEKE